MTILQHAHQQRKAFVDRHRGRNEFFFGIGKVVLLFQTRMGKMLGKLHLRWIGSDWIVATENDTFTLETLAGEILLQKVNGFPLKPLKYREIHTTTH